MLTKKKEAKLEQRVETDKKIADMVQDIEEGFNESIIDEYHKLAGEIGYSTPKIVREKLLKFLKRNDLKIYNRQKVEKFLDNLYGAKEGDTSISSDLTVTEPKPGWCWVALTKNQGHVEESQVPDERFAQDERQITATEVAREQERRTRSFPVAGGLFSGFSQQQAFASAIALRAFRMPNKRSGYTDNGRAYKKDLPLRVLQLINEVKKEIPELSFFVSDVAEPKPDPFLYVSCEGMEGMVIAHWDEPTFKD